MKKRGKPKIYLVAGFPKWISAASASAYKIISSPPAAASCTRGICVGVCIRENKCMFVSAPLVVLTEERELLL